MVILRCRFGSTSLTLRFRLAGRERWSPLVLCVHLAIAPHRELSEGIAVGGVIRAVSQWQVAPVTRGGKAQKLVARQSFLFKAVR